MLVHLVEAVEHGAEMLGADGDHRRQSDRRVHRVAAADPVPEPEHVGGVDAELGHFLGVGRDGHKMPGDGGRDLSSVLRAQSRAVWALVIVSRVVKVFEETMNSVSSASRSWVASAKSVPSTLETKRKVRSRLAVMPQGLVGHHRPQVGAADADVDDVADRLAGVALPLPAAHPVGEIGHLVEHGVDLGHDVVAVHDDRLSLRRRAGRRAARPASP